ncbi:hypothetical protein FWH13_01780 [Candidatus Saccharibacteria bacterium]|nr:hypothetical protein [Candidatus Saccharibacteria bacterium]
MQDYEDARTAPEEELPDPFKYDPTRQYIVGIDTNALYDIASRTILGLYDSVGEVTDDYIQTVIDRLTKNAEAALEIYRVEQLTYQKQLREENSNLKQSFDDARARCKAHFYGSSDDKVVGKIPEVASKLKELLETKAFRTRALDFRRKQQEKQQEAATSTTGRRLRG